MKYNNKNDIPIGFKFKSSGGPVIYTVTKFLKRPGYLQLNYKNTGEQEYKTTQYSIKSLLSNLNSGSFKEIKPKIPLEKTNTYLIF